MQSYRDYAVSLGLAKYGRGRLSREAWTAINKAEAEGMRFKETSRTPAAPKAKDSEDSKPVVKDSNPNPRNSDSFPPIIDPRFPNSDWIATVKGKKFKVSRREVCRACFFSLEYHICHTPKALVDGDIVAVDIVS